MRDRWLEPMMGRVAGSRLGHCTLAVLLSIGLVTGGCASQPATDRSVDEPVRVQSLPNTAPFRDGRAAFRSYFCSALRPQLDPAAAPTDCGRWLWHLRDEPAAELRSLPAALDPSRVEVILVTGAFSECVGEQARPLAAGADRLQAAGVRLRTVVVGGRSGVEHNARQIAQSLQARPLDDDRTVVMIGYSKGGLDILRFMVDYPDLAAGVDAVVALATPVFGTPLADLAAPAYRALLARLPNDKCPAGDGGVMSDLQPAAAQRWLSANSLPANARYYSLAAIASREHVARALVPTWKHIGGPAVRNDGQVVASDAVIPGSTLLGFANADHWGIALTLEDVHPVLLARPDPAPFPLAQLLLAIVAFVADDVAAARAGVP